MSKDIQSIIDATRIRLTMEGLSKEEIEEQLSTLATSLGGNVVTTKKRTSNGKKSSSEVRTSSPVKYLGDWVIAVNNNQENVMLVLEEHDIPYKEQQWKVARREVLYNIKAIQNTSAVKGITERCNCNYSVIEDAYKGEKYRWLEIRTDEIVPTRITVIGYALLGIGESGEVECEHLYLKRTIMTQENIKVSIAEKKIKKAVSRFIINATEIEKEAEKKVM